MEDRLSDIEDKIEEMDTLVEEKIKIKKPPCAKHSGSLKYSDKTKYKNNRSRGRRRNSCQRHRKYSQQKS